MSLHVREVDEAMRAQGWAFQAATGRREGTQETLHVAYRREGNEIRFEFWEDVLARAELDHNGRTIGLVLKDDVPAILGT